jgi:hypothetical protein
MIGSTEKIIQWLFTQDRDKQYEIKEHKEKRSLSQNAYAWKLINELANKLNRSKDDIYLEMLKSYGQNEVVSILSSINPAGYFKYYEPIGTGVINEKEFTHYRIYKGSSEYDSREMAVLIEGIIQEAEAQGIPTLTPEEVSKMEIF